MTTATSITAMRDEYGNEYQVEPMELRPRRRMLGYASTPISQFMVMPPDAEANMASNAVYGTMNEIAGEMESDRRSARRNGCGLRERWYIEGRRIIAWDMPEHEDIWRENGSRFNNVYIDMLRAHNKNTPVTVYVVVEEKE